MSEQVLRFRRSRRAVFACVDELLEVAAGEPLVRRG